jgi:hypothetical protein
MSIDHKFTPAYKESKQLELIVSYEHEGDIIKPDSILVAFSPFTGMWLERMTELMVQVKDAAENNLQSYLESQEERPAEPDERYETEKMLKGWPQAFRS